ncbi:hypothetical protein P167DRAFT_545136 [Morchella conica CCBAS932]|uniref:Uncharacterized protein n=1 Tax=Morchella conica CCBAS932 TaxID=1392247 RepID=A0A3N4KQM8_9PEZI|nr:hypothetical protein P167DRAFT_545136 [Morchella conica CCBAS932]
MNLLFIFGPYKEFKCGSKQIGKIETLDCKSPQSPQICLNELIPLRHAGESYTITRNRVTLCITFSLNITPFRITVSHSPCGVLMSNKIGNPSPRTFHRPLVSAPWRERLLFHPSLMLQSQWRFYVNHRVRRWCTNADWDFPATRSAGGDEIYCTYRTQSTLQALGSVQTRLPWVDQASVRIQQAMWKRHSTQSSPLEILNSGKVMYPFCNRQ